MTIISVLGVVAHVLAPSNQSLATVWFGLLVLDTALFAGLWLFCRVGSWSTVTLRALEAFVLISSALVIGMMGRGLAAGVDSGILDPESPFGPEGRLNLVGFTRAHIGLSLHFGLALGVVARAALVPARAWSTGRSRGGRHW